MSDIDNFKLRQNRIDFDLDGEHFTAKYPKEYTFGKEYLEYAKEFPLALWANKVAFEKPDSAFLDFDVSQKRVDFWLWVAQKIHELDVYQSLSDDFESDEIELQNLRDIDVEVGSDNTGLVATPPKHIESPEGAIISQSPGKESVASKLICDKMGVEPVHSVFIEYSSRGSTFKIAGREEYEDYFDNNVIRIWSNFNELQSTLMEFTENYEPITCFWEMAYVGMELPLAAYHDSKYILLGNQLNTGEAMHDPKDRFTTFEELNQSYVFELAYTDYLKELMGLPIVHTSNVRPFTGYACRKIIGREEPEFLQYMQNCLRPKAPNRWCLRCYKCADAWVEFMACGCNPEDAGLSHEVLVENPHLGNIDQDDWGFSFPRYERAEQIWRDDGAQEFFNENVRSDLTEEQIDYYEIWRSAQDERVSEVDVEHLRRFNGKFVEPVTLVIPDEVIDDMNLPHGKFAEEALDPRDYADMSEEWK